MSNHTHHLDTFDSLQNHAVIVLASGLSQRLGQPKQLLKKNDKPLIDHMLNLALKTQPQTVIIVIPDNLHSIQNAIDPLIKQNKNIELVLNLTPDMGMGHSLYLAIEALTNIQNKNHLSFKNVLILGIDQILLDTNHLKALLSGLPDDYERVVAKRIVASRYPYLNCQNYNIEMDKNPSNSTQTNIEGLPIAISIDLLKRWQSELKGDKGLRHLIRAWPAEQRGTIVNSDLSYDIDTVEQYSHAKQQGWLDK